MRLALISLLMIPLAVGCSTKSAVEKAIEQCMTGCTNYADFMVACGFELGATTEAYCDGQCAGAEAAYDAACENAYDALMDCRVSLNWASAECSTDVIESKLSACAEKDTAPETTPPCWIIQRATLTEMLTPTQMPTPTQKHRLGCGRRRRRWIRTAAR